MALRLSIELPRYGCDVDPAEFRDIVGELKAVMFPSWSDEELLFHPREAVLYAAAVRSRVHCEGLPDSIILRTLIGNRKLCWGTETANLLPLVN